MCLYMVKKIRSKRLKKGGAVIRFWYTLKKLDLEVKIAQKLVRIM
jgi:hypothetical protein